MVSRPEDQMYFWYKTKADRFLIHAETDHGHKDLISQIHSNNRKVGMVLNPETQVDKIKEILNEYPDIKRRDSLNILVALGSQHTRLYSKLKQEGYDVNKEEIPSYGFFDKGMKAYMFGGDIDDELAAKIFLEEEFATAYKKDINGLTDNVINRLHLKQKIISQFSFTEAREIFEEIRGRGTTRDIFSKKLKEKGIRFPQSPAQLKAFIADP